MIVSFYSMISIYDISLKVRCGANPMHDAPSTSICRRRTREPISEWRRQRLPRNTMLYCRFRRNQSTDECALMPAPESTLLLKPPTTAGSIERVCEYFLTRTIHVMEGPPSSGSSADVGDVDGWHDLPNGTLHLYEPASLLQLVDDDKQTHQAQALLPDLFMRCSLSTERRYPQLQDAARE